MKQISCSVPSNSSKHKILEIKSALPSLTCRKALIVSDVEIHRESEADAIAPLSCRGICEKTHNKGITFAEEFMGSVPLYKSYLKHYIHFINYVLFWSQR